MNDLRRNGVTLHLMLEAERQPIPDVPAVYLVQPTAANIDRIVSDAANSLYEAMHLNFTSSLPAKQLEQLASSAVKANAAQKVSKIYDQYVAFTALESNLFSLGLPDAYVELNDPAAKDVQIEVRMRKQGAVRQRMGGKRRWPTCAKLHDCGHHCTAQASRLNGCAAIVKQAFMGVPVCWAGRAGQDRAACSGSKGIRHRFTLKPSIFESMLTRHFDQVSKALMFTPQQAGRVRPIHVCSSELCTLTLTLIRCAHHALGLPVHRPWSTPSWRACSACA